MLCLLTALLRVACWVVQCCQCSALLYCSYGPQRMGGKDISMLQKLPHSEGVAAARGQIGTEGIHAAPT